MFASVREIPRRQFGTGTFVSFAAHAALVAIALCVSSRPHGEPPPKLTEIKLVTAAAARPRPAAPPAGGAPVAPRRSANAARISPPTRPRPVPAPVESPVRAGAQATANDASRGGGAPGDGAPGNDGVQGGGGPAAAPETELIRFGSGMEPPRLLSQTEITFSARAWAEKVGGVALAQCVLELDGSLSHCRITHGLPYMDDPILSALKAWRYTPVIYQGHPQRVIFTIPVRVPRPS